MAEHDGVIDNGTGSAVRTDLNNALAAIFSNNSKSGALTTNYAYQWHVDTSDGNLKIRNAANNAYVTVGPVATTNFGLASLTAANTFTQRQTFSANTSITIPTGTTAQRDGSPAVGMIRHNSTLNQFEGYNDGAWGAFGGSAGKILQVVSTTLTTVASNSTAADATWSFNDSSLKATITAANSSNKFLIMGSAVVGSNGLAVSSILQDGGSNLTGAVGSGTLSNRKAATSGDDSGSTEGVFTLSHNVVLSAGDTNAHNFHYAFFHNGGGTSTLYLNRSNSDTDSTRRGRYISNITVMEIAA